MTSDRYVARQKRLRMGVASLVAASAMFCVVGCTSPEEKKFWSVKVGEPLGDDIPKRITVPDETSSISEQYYFITNRENVVVCKSIQKVKPKWNSPVRPIIRAIEIDGKYIGSYWDYTREMYNKKRTDAENMAEASKVVSRDGISWMEDGWPFRILIYGNEFIFEVYRNGVKISKEEFLKMQESGNLTGVFLLRSYGW